MKLVILLKKLFVILSWLFMFVMIISVSVGGFFAIFTLLLELLLLATFFGNS